MLTIISQAYNLPIFNLWEALKYKYLEEMLCLLILFFHNSIYTTTRSYYKFDIFSFHSFIYKPREVVLFAHTSCHIFKYIQERIYLFICSFHTSLDKPREAICAHTFLSHFHTLREEPIQINIILQQKLPLAKLSTICTVYKQ